MPLVAIVQRSASEAGMDGAIVWIGRHVTTRLSLSYISAWEGEWL